MTTDLIDHLTVVLLAGSTGREQRTVLVFGPGAADLARLVGQPAVPRRVIIRYGFWLHTDSRPFLPTLVLDDFGRKHEGRTILSWIATNGYLQPRSSVFGVWPDGQVDQVYTKAIDKEAGLVALAYPGDSFSASRRVTSTLSLSQPTDGASLSQEPGPDVPALLAEAIPAYRLAPQALETLEPKKVLDILENII